MKRAIYLGLGALLALNAPLGPVQAAEAESSELDLSKEALLSADEKSSMTMRPSGWRPAAMSRSCRATGC